MAPMVPADEGCLKRQRMSPLPRTRSTSAQRPALRRPKRKHLPVALMVTADEGCLKRQPMSPLPRTGLVWHISRRPIAEVEMLIDGVEMDLTTSRYQSWDELRRYCTLVASVIGRMCVRIFGFREPGALQRADELGQALQLINILRDIREDAGRGRIYLP